MEDGEKWKVRIFVRKICNSHSGDFKDCHGQISDNA